MQENMKIHPITVNTCFNKLEFVVNNALVAPMELHLKTEEREDSDFDSWMHGQLYGSEYNAV